jgi:hypothetical protein
MLANNLRYDFFISSDIELTPESAIHRAARYRWTADYIGDPSLSPYLLRAADECERLAGACLAANSRCG